MGDTITKRVCDALGLSANNITPIVSFFDDFRKAVAEFVAASDDASKSQFENDGVCDPVIIERVRVARNKLRDFGVEC